MFGIEFRSAAVSKSMISAEFEVKKSKEEPFLVRISREPMSGMRVEVKHFGKEDWEIIATNRSDNPEKKLADLLPKKKDVGFDWDWDSFYIAMFYYSEGCVKRYNIFPAFADDQLSPEAAEALVKMDADTNNPGVVGEDLPEADKEKILKKFRLHSFLSKVSAAYDALNVLKCDALCAPGVKGMQEELLFLLDVPEKILRAYKEGKVVAWQNGWDY